MVKDGGIRPLENQVRVVFGKRQGLFDKGYVLRVNNEEGILRLERNGEYRNTARFCQRLSMSTPTQDRS